MNLKELINYLFGYPAPSSAKEKKEENKPFAPPPPSSPLIVVKKEEAPVPASQAAGSPYEIVKKELEDRKEDIRPSDVILFSEPLRSALNHVIRLGRFNLTEFTEKTGFTRDETKTLADLLVARKLFTVATYSTPEETFYESRLSALSRPMQRPATDIWKKLD